MTNERDFERIAKAYMADGPTLLADRVLDDALDAIHLTRQRRVFSRVPWRFPIMNTYSKLAAAVVAVIAVGAIGLAWLGSGASSGPGGQASPSPSAAPSASPSPSSAASAATPAISERFTSAINGISISYPAGWVARPATESWATSEVPIFEDQSADVLFDEAYEDHLFLLIASQPLAGKAPDAWAAELAANEPDCGPITPTTVDTTAGWIASMCNMALVPSADRGYVLLLYTSAQAGEFDETAYDGIFHDILATVDFDPEFAADPSAAASP
jgi:hypothetical protein